MKEETYLKAKAVMREVEKLRNFKKFHYPKECYSLSFNTSTGSEINVGPLDIGVHAMNKLIDTYVEIIDDLIDEKMKELEEI